MELSSIRVVVKPTGLPVTPAEYVNHARINGLTVQNQPTLIDRKLKAATKKAENWMNRAILQQTIESTYEQRNASCSCATKLWLPRGNVLSVDAVSDLSLTPPSTIPPSGYTLTGNDLTLATAMSGTGQVTYQAGWETVTDVPDDIIEGILEYATTLYEDRIGDRAKKYDSSRVHGIPDGVYELWRSYQVELPE